MPTQKKYNNIIFFYDRIKKIYFFYGRIKKYIFFYAPTKLFYWELKRTFVCQRFPHYIFLLVWLLTSLVGNVSVIFAL